MGWLRLPRGKRQRPGENAFGLIAIFCLEQIFFSVEVWTLQGLVTFYVLFFIRVESREIHIAGITPHPNEGWMAQIRRNMTIKGFGFLKSGDFLIHDRDRIFCGSLQRIIESAGTKRIALPPRSSDLNAFAERVRSIKEECPSKVILFGESSLRRTIGEYVEITIGRGTTKARTMYYCFPRLD